MSLSFLYEHHSNAVIQSTMDTLGICPWHYYKYIAGLHKAPIDFKMHFLGMVFKYPFNDTITVESKKELLDSFNSIPLADRKKLADYNLYDNPVNVGKILTERFKWCSATVHNTARKTNWIVMYISSTRSQSIPQDIIPAILDHFSYDDIIQTMRNIDPVNLCNTLIKYSDPKHNVLVIMLMFPDKFSSRAIKDYIKVKFGKKVPYKVLYEANQNIIFALLGSPKIFGKLHRRNYIVVNTEYLDIIRHGKLSEDLFKILYNIFPPKSYLNLYLLFADHLCRYGTAAKTKWSNIYLVQADIKHVRANSADAIKLIAIGLVNNKNISTRSIKGMDTYDCCPDITLDYLLGSPMTSIVNNIRGLSSCTHGERFSKTNLSKIPELYVVYENNMHVYCSSVLRDLIKHNKVYISKVPTKGELVGIMNEVGNTKDIFSPAVRDKIRGLHVDISHISEYRLHKLLLWNPVTWSTKEHLGQYCIDTQDWLYRTFPMVLEDNNNLTLREIYGPLARASRMLVTKCLECQKNKIYADISIKCIDTQ